MKQTWKMLCSRSLTVLALLFSVVANTAPWPFDQRQILLVKIEGKDFPDDLTAAQFMDAFVRRGRVRWVTQKAGVTQILPIEAPKDFEWQSALAVKNFGLKYKVDGLVHLEQKGVELQMYWYSTQDGLPLFIEKINLPAPANSQDALERKQRLVTWVNGIWDKIPGRGHVLSRDTRKVRFEGGNTENVRVGDNLELRRIQGVDRHPLLKTVIGVKTAMTGLAKVSRISDTVSEADISYESDVDPIQEGDRYVIKGLSAPVAVQPVQVPQNLKTNAEGRTTVPMFGEEQGVADAPAENSVAEGEDGPVYPKIVELEATLNYGPLSHTEMINGIEYELKKSAPGLELRGRFYLTRNWILSGAFGTQFYSFSSVPSIYNASSISSGTQDVRFDVGYRFIFMEEQGGIPAEVTVQLGYRRTKMSMEAVDSAYAPSEKSYKGLEFVLGGVIPITGNFAAFADMGRTIGANLTETPDESGASSSDATWDFRAGIFYRLGPDSRVLGGLRTSKATSTFEGQGSRTQAGESSEISSSGLFAGYAHSF